MGRKPVAYAPVSFAFPLEGCSSNKNTRERRGQRPVCGHPNKGPAHNGKGIGSGVPLHLLAHCSQCTPVEDYRPTQ